MVDVTYFHKEGERWVCDVCPVHCKLKEGQAGVCRGRAVKDGVLVATNYGQVVTAHMDPIEKKPLYHVAPGETIWSVGPNGCNMLCRWCQNCEISQNSVHTDYVAPQDLAQLARKRGSVGLAYTYTEPLIWFEYLLDVMPLVHEEGGINVLVSNGYIEKEPLEDLLPHVDAVNIDLKFIDADLYKKHSGAQLEYIQHTIQRLHEAGVHVELTHLVVTGLADNEDHFTRLTEWIVGVDRTIPLHISRYSPRHKWQKPPTTEDFLVWAYEEARSRLDHVYLGNILVPRAADTTCPNCGALVIGRQGYGIDTRGLDGLRCANCGHGLPILQVG